ncbi:MAG: hypothetical protein U0821_04875 [Chloroflexota bacterium]
MREIPVFLEDPRIGSGIVRPSTAPPAGWESDRVDETGAAAAEGGVAKQEDKDADKNKPQLINVTGDETVAKLTLAARWAEMYDAREGDSLNAVLARFRRAYGYVDDVLKGIAPAEE